MGWVGLLYLAVAQLGDTFGRPGAILVLPPNGIALGAMLAFGIRVWPGILLGASINGLGLVSEPSLAVSFAIAETFEGWVGAWLVLRFANGREFYRRPRDILIFALLAGALSPLICPPFGLPQASVQSLAFWTHPAENVVAWWLGEMMSVMTITPLFVLLTAPPPMRWNRSRQTEFAVLTACLVVLSAAVFTSLVPGYLRRYLMPYLCLPFPIWAAHRFGPRATAITSFIPSLVMLTGTLCGWSLFGDRIPDVSLAAYQGFASFLAVISLVVTTLVAERGHAQLALQEAYETLDHRVAERTRDLHGEIEVRKQAQEQLSQDILLRREIEETLKRAHDELDRRVQERTVELAEANAALAKEVEQRRDAEVVLSRVLERLIDVQETERQRISRELHDQMGQTLTAMKLGLYRIRQMVQAPVEARESLIALETLSDGLMRDAHRMAWELRPPMLDEQGLAEALRHYLSEWSRPGSVAADFHDGSARGRRFPARIETALYRIAQESLTNVLKHSKASRVSVLLDCNAYGVSLIIEDNGIGFETPDSPQVPSPKGKMGLLGMQERVLLAGGSMSIESAPNTGTTVYVRIPVRADQPEEDAS